MPTESQEHFERLYRRRQVAKLYLRGWTQSAISDKLGVSQATISRDVAEISSEWREETAKSLRVQQEREQARVDALECEIWEAWEQSKHPVCKTQVVRKGDTGIEKTTTTMIEREGDLRYLVLAQKCIPFRRRSIALVHEAQEEPEVQRPGPDLQRSETAEENEARFKDLNARFKEAERARAFKDRSRGSGAPSEPQRPADEMRRRDPGSGVAGDERSEDPAGEKTNPDGARTKPPAETLTGSSHPAPDPATPPRRLPSGAIPIGPPDAPQGVPTTGVPRTGPAEGGPTRLDGTQGVRREGPPASGP